MKAPLDKHGHLLNRNEWSRDWATEMAASDDVELTAAHWSVIEAVQTIFDQTADTPPMRLLIKLLRTQVSASIDSRHLYRLFPDNPVRQASKYAGLPKPKHCM